MSIIKDIYSYEIELVDGSVVYDNNFNKDEVVRITYKPRSNILPSHTIVFNKDYKFVKRFSRTFIKHQRGVVESVHCVITNKFRVYIFSTSGKMIITDKDYELYL